MTTAPPSASTTLVGRLIGLSGDARAAALWRRRATIATRRLDRDDPFARAVTAMVRADALPGPCSIAGLPGRFTARDAAFANGALMAEDLTAPVAAIVAAVAALVEEDGSDEETALAAVAVGVEALDRLQRSAAEGIRQRGHDADGILGAPAATAAAGRAIHLSAGAMVDALGVAGSLASGSQAWPGTGADLLGGWMARSAILAARLAERGFSGPAEVFEGRKGLFNAYAGPGAYGLAPLMEERGQAPV